MELTEEWENADKTLGVQPGEVKHGLTSGWALWALTYLSVYQGRIPIVLYASVNTVLEPSMIAMINVNI